MSRGLARRKHCSHLHTEVCHVSQWGGWGRIGHSGEGGGGRIGHNEEGKVIERDSLRCLDRSDRGHSLIK